MNLISAAGAQILPRSPSGIGPPQAYQQPSIVIDPCQFPTFSRTCTHGWGSSGGFLATKMPNVRVICLSTLAVLGPPGDVFEIYLHTQAWMHLMGPAKLPK